MTKSEIRSLVKNILGNVDKTNRYHPEVIDATIERAFNQAYSDIFMRNPQDLDNYTKSYGADGTAIPVAEDGNTGIDTLTIPADYIPLPDKASGVRGVYTITTGGKLFYPMTATEFDLITRNTHTSNVSAEIGYVVRGGKLEFWNMDATTLAAGVRMEILIPFRTYADTDDVLMPFSRDVDLMQAIFNILGIVPPTDLEDDNTGRDVNVQRRE